MKINKWLLIGLMGLFVCIGIRIEWNAADLMLAHSDYWAVVKGKFTNDSLQIPANRGNILSSDGQLMVVSMPEYWLQMDFKVIEKDSVAREKAQHLRDSLLDENMDTIVRGLARIFPDRSEQWFRNRIAEGRRKGNHAWRIYPRLASHTQYLEVKQLPVFREAQYRGGFFVRKTMQRKKIYGSLASRTLGDVYRDSDAAKSGLEWCYDTLLRGKNGYEHRTKVRNNRVSFVDQEPVHGHDLVSTIDVRIQDIAEKALADQMNEGTLATQAEKGIAIVMEVKTGDIKAMVSLTRVGSGPEDLVEIQNDAINALWEPGSTFKTGSMMVAMEDGYVTPETVVFCHNGVWPIYGRKMKDHNWATKGGYQDLTVTEILGQSSNIGVSKIIDKYYHDCPERFVKGLYKLGVGIDYGLPMGANPRVRMPQREGRHYSNWSNTTLPWMSIGYETQLSPLNTLTFYNAIANGGRMVRPRFVRAEMEGDKLIREFPVEVIKEKICSERTLRWTQEMLEKVVSEGLGGRAGNPRFRVSGKTGTAQVAVNGSYAVRRYLVSFCGYFPADEPQYSCIVAIYKHGLPASGGGQAGPVFSRISQRVMNTGEGRPLGEATDSTTVVYPMMGNGRTDELRDLLNMMQLPWTDYASDARWASIEHDSLTQRITLRAATGSEGQVPNVVGMGARDAVYALREAGLKVRLSGKGRVRQQSIAPGTGAQGQTISITLN